MTSYDHYESENEPLSAVVFSYYGQGTSGIECLIRDVVTEFDSLFWFWCVWTSGADEATLSVREFNVSDKEFWRETHRLVNVAPFWERPEEERLIAYEEGSHALWAFGLAHIESAHKSYMDLKFAMIAKGDPKMVIAQMAAEDRQLFVFLQKSIANDFTSWLQARGIPMHARFPYSRLNDAALR